MYATIWALNPFYGQRDTLAPMVDFDDPYLNVLMEFDYVEWVGDAPVGHL